MQGIAIFLVLCGLKLGAQNFGILPPDQYIMEMKYQDCENFSMTLVPIEPKIKEMELYWLSPGESAVALTGDEFILVPGSRTRIHKEADGIWYFERIDKEDSPAQQGEERR